MKLKLLFILILLAGLVCISPVAAVKGGNGPAKHLYLYEKDANWDIVDGGAWGKMMYKDDVFVFNGHGLVKDTDYALINYIDPWGVNPQYNLLGEGSTNRGGNIHIAGDMITLEPGTNVGGSKVWLVLKSDIDGSKMKAWNPSEYLFEANLI